MKTWHSFLIEIVLICLLVSTCKPVQPTATHVVLPTAAIPTTLPTPRSTETADQEEQDACQEAKGQNRD